MTQRLVELPPEFALRLKLSGNAVSQLKTPAFQGEVDVAPYSIGKGNGEEFTVKGRRIVVMPKKMAFPDGGP